MSVERMPLVWTYPVEAMTKAYRGWRRPVWFGSDEWPGKPDTHWRMTVVFRIPGRYAVVVVPVRLRLRGGWAR